MKVNEKKNEPKKRSRMKIWHITKNKHNKAHTNILQGNFEGIADEEGTTAGETIFSASSVECMKFTKIFPSLLSD